MALSSGLSFGTLPTLSAGLQPNVNTGLTDALALNPNYAFGWAVNRTPNRWHNRSLPDPSTVFAADLNGALLGWIYEYALRLHRPRPRHSDVADAGSFVGQYWPSVPHPPRNPGFLSPVFCHARSLRLTNRRERGIVAGHGRGIPEELLALKRPFYDDPASHS